MAATRTRRAPRKPAARPVRRKPAARSGTGRKARPSGPGVRVLGVDVASYARQLLAESGGDVRKAKDELETTLAALRDHMHAYLEVGMRTVRIPGARPWSARAVDPFDAE